MRVGLCERCDIAGRRVAEVVAAVSRRDWRSPTSKNAPTARATPTAIAATAAIRRRSPILLSERSAAISDESVARAAHRAEAMGAEGFVEFASDVGDVDLDDARVAVVREVPCVVEEIGLGDDFALPSRRNSTIENSFAVSPMRRPRRVQVRAAGSMTRSPTVIWAGRSLEPRRSRARRWAMRTMYENGLVR